MNRKILYCNKLEIELKDAGYSFSELTDDEKKYEYLLDVRIKQFEDRIEALRKRKAFYDDVGKVQQDMKAVWSLWIGDVNKNEIMRTLQTKYIALLKILKERKNIFKASTYDLLAQIQNQLNPLVEEEMKKYQVKTSEELLDKIDRPFEVFKSLHTPNNWFDDHPHVKRRILKRAENISQILGGRQALKKGRYSIV